MRFASRQCARSQQPINRLWLVRSLLIVGFFLLTVTPSFALDHVVLQLKWDHQFQFAGYYAAAKMGYYAEAGLEVEIKSAVSPGLKISKAPDEVLNGRADFGIGAADVIIANQATDSLRIVASIFQESGAHFYIKDGKPFSSLADLVKRYKVARNIDSLCDVEWQVLLRSQGVDPDSSKSYSLETGLDHLISGKVDVIPGYSLSVPYSAAKQGVALQIIDPHGYGLNFYGDSIFTTEKLIETNPDLVRRFVDASLRGWRYALSHKQEIAEHIVTSYPRNAAVDDPLAFNLYQANQIDKLIHSVFVGLGTVDASRWREMYRALQAVGLVHGDFVAENLLWTPAQALAQQKVNTNQKIKTAVVTALAFALFMLFFAMVLRKKVREKTSALAEANKELFAIHQNSPVPMMIVDAERKILKVNRALLAYAGQSEEQVIGQRPGEIFQCIHALLDLRGCGYGPHCSTCLVNEAIQESLDSATEILQRGATLTIAGDQGPEIKHLLISSAPLPELGGRVLLSIEDVSGYVNSQLAQQVSDARFKSVAAQAKAAQMLELQQQSALLEIEKQNYQKLFSEMIDAFAMHEIILDEEQHPCDYRFLAINPAFENALGVTADELVGHRVLELFPQTELSWIEDYGRVAISGVSQQFERYSEQFDSWFEVRCFSPKRGQFAVSFTDITARKKLEQQLLADHETLESLVAAKTKELAEALTLAESANLAKSSFLSNVSHELRTPLTAILGYSQLLSRKANLPSALRPHVEAINHSGLRLHELINDVLEISRIEAGRVEFERAVFDIYAVLSGLEEMFALKFQEKGLEFNLMRDPELPQYLLGDQKKLNQILVNLLGNAVKFTDAGSIRITALVLKRPQPFLEISVQDTGCGISEAELAQLFKPFAQGRGGNLKGGTGLGLVISKKLAKMQGGDLTLRSTMDVGSVFTLTLPTEIAPVSVAALAEQERPIVGLQALTSPKSVLIVDDMDDSRYVMAQLLADCGLEIFAAKDGLEALEVLGQQSIDLLMTDLTMAKMDGYRLIQSVRKDESLANLPIIAVSASAFEQDRQRVLSINANCFVRKPFELSDFYLAVGECLHLPLKRADNSAPAAGFIAPGQGDLSQLSAAMREEFRQALIQLDETAIVDFARRLTQQDQGLGQSIQQLVDQYEYDKLLGMLDGVVPSGGGDS